MQLSPAIPQTPEQALRNHLALTHEILRDLTKAARRVNDPNASTYAQWAQQSGEHFDRMEDAQ